MVVISEGTSYKEVIINDYSTVKDKAWKSIYKMIRKELFHKEKGFKMILWKNVKKIKQTPIHS